MALRTNTAHLFANDKGENITFNCTARNKKEHYGLVGYELVRIPNVEPYTFTHAGKDWTYIPKPKGSAVAKRDTVAMSDKLHKLLVAEIMKAGKPLALPTDTDGKAIPIVIQNIKYIVQFRALKESKKAPAAVAG